jgi:hypothetical protein
MPALPWDLARFCPLTVPVGNQWHSLLTRKWRTGRSNVGGVLDQHTISRSRRTSSNNQTKHIAAQILDEGILPVDHFKARMP